MFPRERSTPALQVKEFRLEVPYQGQTGIITIGRFVVVAAVFVLALFVGIFYRQDLETAAAQTRGTLNRAATRIAPLLNAPKPSWSRLPQRRNKGRRWRQSMYLP